MVEQEHDTKPFFASIRRFHFSSIKEILKKFPIGDSLLNDLGILQPDKSSTYDVSTVLWLEKKFSQLELDTSESLEQSFVISFCLHQKFSPSLLLTMHGIQVSNHIELQRK